MASQPRRPLKSRTAAAKPRAPKLLDPGAQARELLRPLIAERSQLEIATLSGVPQSNISAWLAGRRGMSLDSCAAIAKALDRELVLTLRPR